MRQRIVVVFGASPVDCQRWRRANADELEGAQTIDMWPAKPLMRLPPGVNAEAYLTEEYQAAPSAEVLRWIAEHAPPIESVPRAVTLDGVEYEVTHLDLRLFADYSGAPTAVPYESEWRVFGYFRIGGEEVQFFGSGLDVAWDPATGTPTVHVAGPIAYFDSGDAGDGDTGGGRGGSFVGRRKERQT